MSRHSEVVRGGILERWYCRSCGHSPHVRGQVPFTQHLHLDDVYGSYNYSGGMIERAVIRNPICYTCGGPVEFQEIMCTDHQWVDYLDVRDRQVWAVRYCKICHEIGKRVAVHATNILL